MFCTPFFRGGGLKSGLPSVGCDTTAAITPGNASWSNPFTNIPVEQYTGLPLPHGILKMKIGPLTLRRNMQSHNKVGPKHWTGMCLQINHRPAGKSIASHFPGLI